jgi:hypothetical protein
MVFDAGQLRESLQVQAAAGMSAGIYSARNYWTSAAGNTAEFSYLPLWDARYLSRNAPWPEDVLGSGTSRPWVAYGGWTAPVMWQWINTVEFCGHTVDKNVYDREAPKRLPFWVMEGEP